MSKQAPPVWIIDGKLSKSQRELVNIKLEKASAMRFRDIYSLFDCRQKKDEKKRDTVSINVHTIDGRQLKRVATIIIDYSEETFIVCLLI